MDTAEQYITWRDADEVSWEEQHQRFLALPLTERYRVHRLDVEPYFTPENRAEDSTETLSPCGKYKLVTTKYETKPGCWSYVMGEVYRLAPEPVKVAEVRRNYMSLWCAWVVNHKVTGHDYLITGEDYQGITICNLTTGKQISHIPDDANKGFGWCAQDAKLLVDGTSLEMGGCYWAGPHEFRIYDFSHPDDPAIFAQGLPWLTQDLCLEDEGDVDLQVSSDGSLVYSTYEWRHKETGEENFAYEARVINSIREAIRIAEGAGDTSEVDRLTERWRNVLRETLPRYNPDQWVRVLVRQEIYVKREDGFYEAQEPAK